MQEELVVSVVVAVVGTGVVSAALHAFRKDLLVSDVVVNPAARIYSRMSVVRFPAVIGVATTHERQRLQD